MADYAQLFSNADQISDSLITQNPGAFQFPNVQLRTPIPGGNDIDPYNVMPIAQRMEMRDYMLDQARQETQLRNMAIQQESDKMDNIYRQKTMDQASQYFERMRQLDPSDVDNYQASRASLNAELPLGAQHPAVQKHLSMLDETHSGLVKTRQTLQQKEDERLAAINNKRMEQAWKLAEKMGPQVLEDFSALSEKNPEMAISKVASMAQSYQRANTVTQLRNMGLRDEDIQRKYLVQDPETGSQFFAFDAAEADIDQFRKTQNNSMRDQAAASRIWATLRKQKQDAGGDPSLWSDENEAALLQAEEILMNGLQQQQSPASMNLQTQAPGFGGPQYSAVNSAGNWDPGQSFRNKDGKRVILTPEGKYRVIQ